VATLPHAAATVTIAWVRSVAISTAIAGLGLQAPEKRFQEYAAPLEITFGKLKPET
jgi:hypothetical protein